MNNAYHETMHSLGNLGIKVSMAALESAHIPPHWHSTMEILFCLNGQATVTIEHEQISLQHGQIVVFDANVVHAIHSRSRLYMFLVIHVDKRQLSVYCPNLDLYRFECRPIPFTDPRATAYIHLCQLAHDLTRVNIEDESTRAMRSDGTALLMLSDLIKEFSVYSPPGSVSEQTRPNETIHKIITYVTEHYQEPLSLKDAAASIGISKEYFCRLFKEHMGITFLRYLNEVRISHADRLLTTTDLSIAEVMQQSGFTNQTMFNRLFKEIYGITPRQARKTAASQPPSPAP